MLTLDKVYHAAYILRECARKTDLIAAPLLSEEHNLYLKTENLQVTGSFKLRGAYFSRKSRSGCRYGCLTKGNPRNNLYARLSPSHEG